MNNGTDKGTQNTENEIDALLKLQLLNWKKSGSVFNTQKLKVFSSDVNLLKIQKTNCHMKMLILQ